MSLGFFGLVTRIAFAPGDEERTMRRSISTMGMMLVALGALGVVAALVALNRTPDRGAQFNPSRDLSEAVADPDNFFVPHLQA
jgi:hypothetical protein